jgi:hypothetical protein
MIMSDKDDTRPVQGQGGAKQEKTLESMLENIKGEHKKQGYDKVKGAIKALYAKRTEHETAMAQIDLEMEEVFDNFQKGILPK